MTQREPSYNSTSLGRRTIKVNGVYDEFFKCSDRRVVLYGGAGSGKSYAVAQKIIARCLAQPGTGVLVARKVFRTCRDSTWPLLKEVIESFGAEHEVGYNESSLKVFFRNGSKIQHAGLDNTEKLKSIHGIGSIWVEEASEITADDYWKLDLRLRGKTVGYKQYILTLNPVSNRLWIKEDLVDTGIADYVKMTTYKDNAFIDEEYKYSLERLPLELQKIYLHGEWGTRLEGIIFDNWRVVPGLEVEPDFFGVDFGWNAPTTLVAIQNLDPILRIDNPIYASHLTTADFIARIKQVLPKDDLNKPFYCDAAEGDRIREMQLAGINAIPADKNVTLGIDMLKRFELHLTPESIDLRNELSEYIWDKNRSTGELRDLPVKKDDHAIDAARYAVYSHLGSSRPTIGAW